MKRVKPDFFIHDVAWQTLQQDGWLVPEMYSSFFLESPIEPMCELLAWRQDEQSRK